jgi:hypothetical protein
MSQSNFPISIVIRAIDKATAPIRKINDQVKKISEPARRLNNAFKAMTLEAGFGKLHGNIKHLGSALAHVKEEAIALAKRLVAISALAGGALFGIVKTTADQGDHIAKAAQQLGVSTTRLQEWYYAVDRAGIGQTEFEKSLQILGKNVALASIGMGRGKDALKALGIQTKDAKGHVKGLDALLPQLAEKFSHIHNANVRNALAMQLFGEEGVKMGNLFKDGSQGLNQMAARAHALGLVLSNETVKAAESFEDSWSDLKATFIGVKNILGAALLPALQKLMNQLIACTIQNREAITTWVNTFVKQLPSALEQIIKALSDFKNMMMPFFSIIRAIIPLIGGVKGVIILLATALTGKLLLAVFHLTNAFRGLMLTLLANPVLVMIAALIAASILLIAHWNDIKKTICAVMKHIKNQVQMDILFIEHIVQKVFTSIKEFLDNLNPFAAIYRGIEQAKALLNQIAAANIAVTSKASLQQPWGQRPIGASHLMQRLQSERFGSQRQEAAINVRFENTPKGTRIQTVRSISDIRLETSMGMQMIN